MEVELKFDSWDRIVSSVCIQSMNIPLSIIVCCSSIALCRLFSIISCFWTIKINHLWYIYKRKEHVIKTEGKMEWDISGFSISVIFFIRNIFIRCITISYCHLYIYDRIIPFFISSFFYLCFIRLISNQLNNLSFFFLIILDPISLVPLEFNNASSL